VEHVQLLQEQRRRLQQQQETQNPTDAPYNPTLLFNGNLLNDLGQPVENAQIQFWHADYHGNYFHPGDDLDGKELMKDTFSYFGTATTNANGDFDFTTYRPGIYIGRPVTHIHYKVFFEGNEVLTSQFYFEDENVSRWYDQMQILRLEEGVDSDGNIFLSTNKQVVVNMRLGGYTKLTPLDVDGPFYPLVDFFDIGNDMTSGLLRKFYGSESPTMVVTIEPTREPTRRPSHMPSANPLPRPSSPPEEDLFDFIAPYGENFTIDGNYTSNFNTTDDDELDYIDSEDYKFSNNTSHKGEENESDDNKNTTAMHDENVDEDMDMDMDVDTDVDADADANEDEDEVEVKAEVEAEAEVKSEIVFLNPKDKEESSAVNGNSETAALELPTTIIRAPITTIGEDENDKEESSTSNDEEGPWDFDFNALKSPWNPVYNIQWKPIIGRLPKPNTGVASSRAITEDKSKDLDSGDRDGDKDVNGKDEGEDDGLSSASSDGRRFLRSSK